MPYHVKKSGGGYKVTSAKHPHGFSKKPLSKEKARKQQAAIYANTHGESFARRLEAVLENIGGMDLYSVRESIKNALANMLHDPNMLWRTLSDAYDASQQSPEVLTIVQNMMRVAERWLQDIKGSHLLIQDRGSATPRPPRDGEPGYQQFRTLYDRYSRALYEYWSGFDKLMQARPTPSQ